MSIQHTITARTAVALLASLVFLAGSSNASEAADARWQSLLPAIDSTDHAVAGVWRKTGKSLTVAPSNGARIMLPVAPAGEYDLRISFTRKTGRNSIGAVVVQNGRQVAFEVDAWGKNLSGFQNIGDRSIQENPTRREDMQLKNGRRYTLTIEVRKEHLRSLLDDQEIARIATDGKNLSLPDLWSLPAKNRLALLAWNSTTEFHAVDVRAADGNSIELLKGDAPAVVSSTKNRPSNEPTPTEPPSKPTGKSVLIVIANGDFFYREYADPRAELERRGIRVVVAAGRKTASRPHSNSGQGRNDGVVTPDIALKNVKASDYDSILFSGGWGASMYQYAFEGRYDKNSYNGDAATKREVNRIINEFIDQEKYVCALCNAVSVLAWARVDGKSPLAGKRVCAPTRDAPSGIYNGRRAQPSCRWHPEQNRAVMSPPGAVGNPRTNTDDVIVDGKIITGEDDPSAAEMGRRIASVLLD